MHVLTYAIGFIVKSFPAPPRLPPEPQSIAHRFAHLLCPKVPPSMAEPKIRRDIDTRH